MENNKSIENKKNIKPSFLSIGIVIGVLFILLIWFFGDLLEKIIPNIFSEYWFSGYSPDKENPDIFLEYWGLKLFYTVLIVISMVVLYSLDKDKSKGLSELKSEVIDLCKSIEKIEDKLLIHHKNKEFRFTNFKKLDTAEKLEFSKDQQRKINKNISKNKFNNIISELNIIDNLSQTEKKISILNSLFANAFVTISIFATPFSIVLSNIISPKEKFDMLTIIMLLYLFVFSILIVFYLFLLSKIYSEKIYDNLSYSDYSILIPTYIDILRNNLISIQDNNNNNNIIKKNQKNIKGKNLFSEEKIETVLTKTRTKTKTRNIKKR